MSRIKLTIQVGSEKVERSISGEKLAGVRDWDLALKLSFGLLMRDERCEIERLVERARTEATRK